MMRALAVICFLSLTFSQAVRARQCQTDPPSLNLWTLPNPSSVSRGMRILMRHAESDRNGRFVFDGLGEGEYELPAFAHGYPLNTQLLAGPRRVHIDRESCDRQILLSAKNKDGN